MEIQQTTLTVADYCAALDRGEVRINPDYQRSDRVWPSAARSFLIETILLGFPMPKLSLHQRTDVRSRRSIKEVVDGQQRTRAVRDFYDNAFRLSPTLELEDARGKRYSQLDIDLQERFLDYGVGFDVFVAATAEEVREVFRRMNSFTVPLNPEEHRHAVYQGPFKWFIHKLTGDYADAFLAAGVFGSKQLVRMADAKLVTEIAHAYFHGIMTTNRRALDALYRSRNTEFPEEETLGQELRTGLDLFFSWTDIHDTALVKPYNVYALVLAAMHLSNRIKTLEDTFPAAKASLSEDAEIQENLTELADALDADEPPEALEGFVDAASERTNVADQRRTRFQWLCRALSGPLPE
jgi:hypothetical protein